MKLVLNGGDELDPVLDSEPESEAESFLTDEAYQEGLDPVEE